MAKCNNCKKEIQYNKFKRYRGKILCPECYKTRLIRKKEKKAKAEEVELNAKDTAVKAKEFGFAPSNDDMSVPSVLTDGDTKEDSKDD